MKSRLFKGEIEYAHIKGKPDEIYDVVTNIDKSMNDLADKTYEMKQLFLKINSSNAGDTFHKASDAMEKLSKRVKGISEELNNIQNDVCSYIENNCNGYEGRSSSFPRRKMTEFSIAKNIASTSELEYSRENINELLLKFKTYATTLKDTIDKIEKAKERIGNIWCDPQYEKFSSYIENSMHDLKKLGYDAYSAACELHQKSKSMKQ